MEHCGVPTAGRGVADFEGSEIDTAFCQNLEVGSEADEEIVIVSEGLRSPTDFGDGKGTGEGHVFAVSECLHVFRPNIALDTEDSGVIFRLDFGNDGIEAVDLLEGEIASDGKGFFRGSRLVVVKIHMACRGHDDVLSKVGGSNSTTRSAPTHDSGSFGESTFEDFIPANKTTTVLVEMVFHLLDEPRLKFVFVFESSLFHSLLLGGVFFPLGLGALITADVNELAGEDVHDLGEDVAAELDRFGFGVEDSVTHSPPHHNFSWFAVTEFGICGDGSDHMARHIYFGDNGDVAFCGVRDDFAEIVLGVEATVRDVVVLGSVSPDDSLWSDGADLGEARVLLNFDSPALIIGEVEVERVDFEESKRIDEFEDFRFGGEVTGDIEHDSAPFEAGLVCNGKAGNLPVLR